MWATAAKGVELVRAIDTKLPSSPVTRSPCEFHTTVSFGTPLNRALSGSTVHFVEPYSRACAAPTLPPVVSAMSCRP